MEVKKRDGRIVPFNKEKIINAILAAFLPLHGYNAEINICAKTIANNIEEHFQNIKGYIPNIEEIQDLVEKGLMETDRKDVAKSYILYRDKRNLERERNSQLTKNVAEKLRASNVQNQNANIDEYSFGGRMGEANEVVSKQYALNYCISEKARKNHINNRIYIHDLGAYAVGSHNCLTIPFDDLLANGFNTRQSDIRPANSVGTAFQLVAVIFQLQSLQQFGGVSASHIDWTMVPYVRKSFAKHYKKGLKYVVGLPEEDIDYEIDFMLCNAKEYSIEDEEYKAYSEEAYDYALELTKEELVQAVESLYHNLNTLQSRSGNQLPFTSLNYGTCPLKEGRMVIEELLEGSIKGTGKFHKTSIFPCGIFQCMKGINRQPSDPNYDLFQLALKSTSERLYPNYANVDWSGNAGYDPADPRTYFSTMGKCKL